MLGWQRRGAEPSGSQRKSPHRGAFLGPPLVGRLHVVALMADRRQLSTQFAARAVSFAETFTHAVQDVPVGQYRGEMTAPEASTGGGVRVLQHIRLVPPEGGGRTFVVGNADTKEKMAELRSLAYVDGVSMSRFGAPSGLDPQAYAAFVDRASSFLELLDFTVVRANQPPPVPLPLPVDEPPRVRSFALAAWLLALLAIGVVLVVIAMRRRWLH